MSGRQLTVAWVATFRLELEPRRRRELVSAVRDQARTAPPHVRARASSDGDVAVVVVEVPDLAGLTDRTRTVTDATQEATRAMRWLVERDPRGREALEHATALNVTVTRPQERTA